MQPPKLETPATINELVSILVDQTDDPDYCYAWRGQANLAWTPYPGIYRRLLNNGYSKEDVTEDLVLRYETDPLCEANGLGYYGEAGGTRLNFMIDMQHQGAATRLLDVTRNYLVALWFASRSPLNTAGVIYRYIIRREFYISSERLQSWDDITTKDLAGIPILVSPKQINERIKAQQAIFLTSVLSMPLSEGSVFTNLSPFHEVQIVLIDFRLKPAIQQYLEHSYGIREFDLFPDFPGYAHANAQNSTYLRKEDELFNGDDGLFPRKYDIKEAFDSFYQNGS